MLSRLLLIPITGALHFGAPALVRAQPAELVALTSAAGPFTATFARQPLPPDLLARMKHSTWHSGCPAPLDDLRLLRLSYWDFNGTPREGELIVNNAVADDVEFIFKRLFEHGFLIERMRPVEEYDGNDEKSMEANNTSSFNCRDVTGNPGHFSNHSWGRAIDINPLTNPMILHGKPLPPQGEPYVDRSKAVPGSILIGSFIVQLFRSRDWTWGGDWKEPDYQHFEKPEPNRK